MLLHVSIVSCKRRYPVAKVHVGEISYTLSCDPMVEGFRRRTFASNLGPPQNSTTWMDDLGSSPVHAKILTGYLAAKVYIGKDKVHKRRVFKKCIDL